MLPCQRAAAVSGAATLSAAGEGQAVGGGRHRGHAAVCPGPAHTGVGPAAAAVVADGVVEVQPCVLVWMPPAEARLLGGGMHSTPCLGLSMLWVAQQHGCLLYLSPAPRHRSTSGTTRCWWQRRTSARRCWTSCTGWRWVHAAAAAAAATFIVADGCSEGRITSPPQMEPFIRLWVLDECRSLWLQNEKRQLETALVVEGQQGAGLKRSISSEHRGCVSAGVQLCAHHSLPLTAAHGLGGGLRLSLAGWC